MLSKPRIKGRRTRRGLSLIETALVIAIVAISLQGGIQVWKGWVARQTNEAELWALSKVADAGESLARQDLLAEIEATRATATSVRELTEAELRATGVLSDMDRMFSSTGRAIDAWVFSPSAEELIIIARATGDLDRLNIPRGADGLGRVGWVSPLAPTLVRGPGLELDVAYLQANHGIPVAGDTIAVRYLNVSADLRPFLYRTAVDPAFAELNRMETHLDLGGSDLSNVGDIAAQSLSFTTATVESLTLTGQLAASDMTVSGLLEVGQGITATEATIDELVTDDLIAGATTLGTLDVTGTVTADTVTVADSLIANDATVTDTLTASQMQTNNLTTQAVATNWMNAETASTEVFTSVGSGLFETIFTGGCTGC